MCDFAPLHCHTQYSLLDGAADIDTMIKKAKADNMPAVAITDHGNMFGVFKHFAACKKHGVKPILGCEVYVVEDRFNKKFTRENKDKRYHQLLLAKNETGYKNLMKLVSLGFIDGIYMDFPRVDRELLKQYKEGIIATTCCIGAEVPQTMINKGVEAAEKIFLEWLDIYGDDYYIELQRHGIEDLDGTGWSQEKINQELLKIAAKHKVKVIATNDSHYVDQKDSEAHDILLCLQTGKDFTDPNRFKFPNNKFFFKTQFEMKELFKDIPQAIENTLDIVEKVQHLNLERNILLPAFQLPVGFTDQNEYLKFLAFEGARKRWGEILPIHIIERLDFELKTIQHMGFPGYFLIVQDFINEGRKLNVAIGPGRGSAAGSAVAYAIGITNVDPIKYNLLFERFLNPERISMPDIDIDFDDEGRQKVIDYVVEKYGKNQVAQIITYGTMAAKSSIKDVGRVLKVPLSETDKMSKLVPERPKVTLAEAFKEVEELRAMRDMEGDMRCRTLKLAENLEGSIRNRGIHASAVIIAPDDISNYVPVCTSKDADLLVTQFDGSIIENAGMLKMDFLGLKTLTIIRDAVKMIEKIHGIKIILDDIPLDDKKTFELYQRGDTIGTFQFESAGMQKYLRDLKPDKFDDLIAMNALYRPGPMAYIPEFVLRKHGKKEISYDLPAMEELLKETYGITVYQEQVMLLSQKLAGFSKGKADELRKAMGKKDRPKLDSLKPMFVEGCTKNDIPEAMCLKIWTDWEKFAEYAFNKSHSTCYAMVAFQTAYLKAHYPAEYMASVMSHNMSDIKQINFFLSECRRMNVPTLGPDINESDVKFSVNKAGEIRFALSAIKGCGENAVSSILEEREKNGSFRNIFDLTKRINLRAANKKNLEALAQAGAFDSFPNIHRAQYFHQYKDDSNFIELAIRYGNNTKEQNSSTAFSLFGDTIDNDIPEPEIPHANPWHSFEKLQKEKEVTGIYISGHPLDDFELEIKNYTNADFDSIERYRDKEVTLACMVSSVNKRSDKNGRPWAIVTVEDMDSSMELAFFNEDYNKYFAFLEHGNRLLLKGIYKQSFRDKERYELRVNQMEFLQDVLDKYCKGLRLLMHYKDLDEQKVEKIYKIVSKNQGKKPFAIYLFDDSEQPLTFQSSKTGVRVSKDLFLQLSEIPNIAVKLIV
ncbi:MAG: polymerase subunit alpha [Bacteroidota bacterium]|nr:polymerase subunit alpha [Bacteroidota bacterium]